MRTPVLKTPVRLMALFSAAVMIATLLVAAPTPAAAQTVDHPVIVVAGTASPAAALVPLQARLLNDGYDAYIYELPGLGFGDIGESTAPLVGFVADILAATGADKVDLVAHSQGGLVARYYIKNLGGDATVDSLVTLGTPNNGTALANIGNVLGIDGICIACEQMSIGSSFLNDLNAGDDTIGSVSYTNLYTSFDEIVFPAQTARLDDGATNVRLQSQCWARVVGHVGLTLDGAIYSGVEDALEHRQISFNCWAI